MHFEGKYHQLPSQHGIRVSSENLRIHHKTCAIYKKCHFLWRLGMNITAKARSAVSKSFWSDERFIAPFVPTWEAGAFAVFRMWHHVRELETCWLRGIVQ